MSYVVTPDTLPTLIDTIMRRLDNLENTNPLSHSSVVDGLFTVFDASNNVRFEAGALPAKGVSPGGQYGPRAWNASGQLLFDPTTLANVGTLLGLVSQGPGQNVTSTSFITLTPNIAFNFTLSYPTRVRFFGFCTAKQNTAAKVGYVRVNLVGQGTTGNAKFGGGATNNSMDVTNAFFELFAAPGSTIGTLAAGSYTVQMEASTDSGGTLYFDQGYLGAHVLSPAAY